MLKRNIYILISFVLLFVWTSSEAQNTIDKLCGGAVRTYRVDGEPGLTYSWVLKNSSGSQIMMSSGSVFVGTDLSGNKIEGSEISISWTFGIGIYTLSVEKQSIFGCSVEELGNIEVMPKPVVDAGPDQVVCADATTVVGLSAAKATDITSAGVEWTTSGDGSFDNPNAVNPIYTPGAGDLLAGKVTLKITAKSFIDDSDGCSAEDDIDIILLPKQKLVITDPEVACVTDPVDLTAPSITAGSIISTSFTPTYWTDALATTALLNPTNVLVSGTYYIKVGDDDCFDIQPVNVVVNPIPKLVITNPAPVCEGETVDISTSYSTDPGVSVTYWTNAAATLPLANYTAIGVGGTYYIKASDGTECSNVQPVEVRINTKETPQFNIPKLLCLNSAPPALPTTSDNGIQGSWNPSAISTGSIGTTTYEFTPNAGECAEKYSLIIEITDEIVPVFANIGPYCQGSLAPGLPVKSDNNIAGTWSPTSIVTTNAGTTDYIFTPDPGQCANPVTIPVTINPIITPTFAAIGSVCQNAANPLPAKSIEGISGTWSPAFSSATTGTKTYTFTPAVGECANSTTVSITIVPSVDPLFNQIGPLCANDPVLTLPTSSNNTPAINGTWSPLVVDMTRTRTYVFTPDAAGVCANPVSMTIVINSLEVTVVSVTPISSAHPTGSIDLSVTGGSGSYSFLWTGPNGYTSSLGDISGLAEGNYAVEVIDLITGCQGKSNALVNKLDEITVRLESTDITCPGGSDGTVTAYISGGTPPYSIQWKNSPAPVATNSSIVTLTGLKADPLFYADVFDAKGDRKRSAFQEIRESSIVYTIASVVAKDPVCYGQLGTIELTFGSGGNVPNTTYDIYYDGGTFHDIEIAGNRASIPALPGTYNNIWTEIRGCPTNAVSTIVGPAPPPLVLPTIEIIQPDCDILAGTIKVVTPTPAAGITYTLKGVNPVVLPITNATGLFTGLAAGVYDLAYTNAMGCTSVPAVSVTINAHPASPANPIALPVPLECEDVPIQTLNANNYIAPLPAGVVIVWYDAPTGGNVVAQPILNSAQTVTYYAEATNGECSSPGRTSISLTIIPRPGSPVSMGDLSACESSPMVRLDARNAIDPASIIDVRWFTVPIGGTEIANPTWSTVGSITYYAENNGGICSSSPRIPVRLTIYRNPAAPQLNLSEVPKCSDSFGIVNVISPIGPEYVYSVDNGPFEPGVTLNMLPGSHRVKAKNTITGCLSPETGIIIPDIPPQPHITNLTAENSICYGDLGQLNFEFQNVADGTYVIVYIGGEFNDVEVLNGKASISVAAGKYDVLAIKANGCTSPENWNVEITQPDKLSISAKITEIDLKSGQKGEIDLTISGGSGLYTTVWEPNLTSGFAGATSEDIKDLSNGDYFVNVTDEKGCIEKAMLTIPLPNMPPIATNDEFDANCNSITGDLLYTDNGSGIDSDPDNDPIEIDVVPLKLPSFGTLTINPDGTFVFSAVRGHIGDDTFIYRIYDVKKNYSNPATVTIHIAADSDGDGIIDNLDPDADGDGILNVNEILLAQDWITTDSDGDGNPNYLDIDSDGDGILDYTEAQSSSGYLSPKGTDTDKDGVDDAYDPDNGGSTLIPINTDLTSSTGGDDLPDFLDTDSDDDLVPDYIEGHDVNADGRPDVVMSGKDFDADGLDDVYDTLANDCSIDNAFAGNAAVQDFDLDGKRDWRDENDDDDEYLTRFEDLNMDGDFSNDDTDFDRHPEYLDYGRDCDLFVPDAFSPNNDNIHDYFMVYCINHFPNAQMFIFDQNGNKLFEKSNYGNLAVWGTPDRAWWDGRTTVRGIITNNGKVIPGTYYYVLKLGNGDVRKSFVFVSY